MSWLPVNKLDTSQQVVWVFIVMRIWMLVYTGIFFFLLTVFTI